MQVGADRADRVRSASKPDRIEIALAYLIDPLQQLVDVVVLRVQVADSRSAVTLPSRPSRNCRMRLCARPLPGEKRHGGVAYGRVRRGETKTSVRLAGRWRSSPRTAEPMRRHSPSRGTSRKR